MAVTGKWYAKGLQALASKTIDWNADTIKASLHTSAYAPSQANDQFFTDATSEVAAVAGPPSNGYTAGGAALAGKSIALNALVVSLRAAATVWTPGAGVTLNARIIVVRKDTGVAGTSPLLGWVDLGADVSATGAAFTVTWDVNDGVLKLTAS